MIFLTWDTSNLLNICCIFAIEILQLDQESTKKMEAPSEDLIFGRVMLYVRLLSPSSPPRCNMAFKIIIGFKMNHYWILIQL
jgi:hypothetical protein